MKIAVPALAAAFIATVGVGSVAQAATIDFGVSIVPGTDISYMGPDLQASTEIDFSTATLLVTSPGPESPAFLGTVALSPMDIMYGATGSGTGLDVTIPTVTKTWTATTGDKFTETLTTLTAIDRTSTNALTFTLSGMVTDTDGLFKGAPALLELSADQVAGPGTRIQAGFTNSSSVPEPSTWVMLALGFAGLGYAAVRRNAKDKAAFAV